MKFSILSALSASLLLYTSLVSAQAKGVIYQGSLPDDLNGSNYTYPWPVKLFRFTSQLQELEMAFMEVLPRCRSNGKTALLLHGKNFCGPTWEGTIRALGRKGYRVIAPDQVGFCKSSKPSAYQFSLHQLAWNTRGLLEALNIGNVTVIGHSMGGMLAARYSLQYPETVDEMVMVNAVGMEDYVQKGVPYVSIDNTLTTELASSYSSIRGYEQATYYMGEWKEEYDKWVKMLVNIYYGSERDNYVRNQAQIVDMVLTQPVVHYFKDIQARTLVAVGTEDSTAIGASWAPREVAAKLGHFDVLGREVAGLIPNGQVLEFPGLGHAPQISQPDRFHEALKEWLSDSSHPGDLERREAADQLCQ